jgi:penicillin-binding protein 1A
MKVKVPAATWVRRAFWVLNALILVVALGVGGFVFGGLGGLEAQLPKVDELAEFRPRLVTEVYSTELMANGEEQHTLLARLYHENREWAPLDQIPADLIHATVAIEDREFFKHRGVDPKGIMRALLTNLRAGHVRQGGSTITQQLVKAIWLSPERTMARKLKELVLAMEVERKYTKEEIVEMYLNEVCYGHAAYGVRAASKMYFGKEPKELTLEQCALLAGLPRRPRDYSPYDYAKKAKARRDQVLEAMADLGYVARAKAEELARAPLGVEKQLHEQGAVAAYRAPYFTEMVKRQLVSLYGEKLAYEGGLRVYTSLDMRIQKAAEEEMGKWIESLRRNGMLKRDLKGQGALLCMATQTGDVEAVVGGVGPYEKVQYNRAAPGPPFYGRQPGSAFKPYVWTTALESGYGPGSVVNTDNVTIRIGPGKYWSPRGGHGSYTLASALAASINRASVRLLLNCGAEKVRNYAARMMNVDELRMRAVPSLALGTSEVSPLDMATGFCCFPTGGLRPTPRFVRRITDINGNILVEASPHFERVIEQPTAVSMVKMMQGVIAYGTGTRARIDWPCAGKTGTAQDSRDTWFVGYTPDLCAAIWIGNDDHSPLSGGAFGGTYCAPVWGRFMARAMKIYPIHGKFPGGEGVTGGKSDTASEKGGQTVTLCRQTNELATPYCPSTYEKTLGKDEKSPRSCHVHRASSAGEAEGRTPDMVQGGGGGEGVTVCAESGQLATPYCPNTVERSFPKGKGPSGSCTIHGHRGGEKHEAGGKAGGEKAGPAGGEKAPAKPGGEEPPPTDANE